MAPWVIWLTWIGIVWGQASPYDVSKHITFLDSNFQIVRSTSSDLLTRKIDAKTGVARLGEILGQSRRLQLDLTTWLKTHPKAPGKRIMRLIQVQDLFEAYLATELIALDGDRIPRRWQRPWKHV